jgi:AcrR family transcriptional regulator
MEAAEELFAAHGYDATSVRDITDAADANLAAIHYHFGSKEALLRELTDSIVAPLNARRRELLDQLPPQPTLDQVLDAFIRPDVETLRRLEERKPTMARFLGRIYGDGTPWIQEMAVDQFSGIARALFPTLASTLPHLSEEEIAWRLRQVVAMVINLFATYPAEGLSDAEAEATVNRLVHFITPAMSSPPATGR